MKKRNLLTQFAALTLTGAMVLTGCSGGKTEKPAGQDTTAAAEGEAAANDAAAAPVAEGPGFDAIAKLPKLSDEKVSFTMAVSQEVSQMDWNQMQFFKALEAATNVHVDFSCYPQVSYNDQKNLMLASGEYPDAFIGYGTLNMSDINQYGPMGIFIPVEDLIDQYCPNYKARLQDRPVLDGLTDAFDGHKYSWGTVNEHPNRDFPDNLYINKSWLDKLGLEVPTTMDEYYDVLKAFKEQDPNGNGQADEIPYTFSQWHHIQGYGGFFGAYGRAEAFNGNKDGKFEDHFVVENGKVIYEPVTEEYKTAIRELSRFFKDGLFDQEGFVQDNEQYNAKVTSQTPIVGSMYIWDVLSMSPENQEQYIAIKPLKATADSEDARVHKRQNHISIQPTGFSITNKCKNPEILAQWVDLFYSEEMSILAYYGPDKVTGIDENGVFSYDESVAADGGTFYAQTMKLAPYDGSPKFFTFDMLQNKMILESNNSKKVDVIKEFYLDAPASVTLPTMNYTAEETDLFSNYGLSCQKYVMEMQSKWLLGQSDIDADWDGYLKQLQTLKQEDFVQNMQQAYDRTIGK